MKSKNTSSFNSELELLGKAAKQRGRNISKVEEHRKIDFILVYIETNDEDKNEKREIYEKNLRIRGLELEHVPSSTVCKIFLFV